MMDLTDNGSDGVGQLWQEVIGQSGLTKEEFPNQTQILEGDLGTCLNFDGLRNQREATKLADENLEKHSTPSRRWTYNLEYWSSNSAPSLGRPIRHE